MNGQADIRSFIREFGERAGLGQEEFAAKLDVIFPNITPRESGHAKLSPLPLTQSEDLLRDLCERSKDFFA